MANYVTALQKANTELIVPNICTRSVKGPSNGLDQKALETPASSLTGLSYIPGYSWDIGIGIYTRTLGLRPLTGYWVGGFPNMCAQKVTFLDPVPRSVNTVNSQTSRNPPTHGGKEIP